MRHPLPLRATALVLLLAGCAGGAQTDPAGTWIGRLHTVAGRCPDTEDSDLVVSGKSVTFVPGDGVLSLRGERDPADRDALHAQFLGHDMNHHLLPMVFDGRLADGAVSGTFGTPTCRATITLHRPPIRRCSGCWATEAPRQGCEGGARGLHASPGGHP